MKEDGIHMNTALYTSKDIPKCYESQIQILHVLFKTNALSYQTELQ